MRLSLLLSPLLVQIRVMPVFENASPEKIDQGLDLQKRGCNQDNVLWTLKAHSSAVSSLCITYNRLPTPTTTVSIAGITPLT